MKKNRICGCVLGIMLAVCVLGIMLWLYTTGELRHDMQRIETESYNGIFVSSHGADNYDENIFRNNRGLSIVIAGHEMRRSQDYVKYFDAAWASGNTITNMYVGMDPHALWKEADGSAEKWNELVNNCLVRYVEAHPEAEFEIILPHQSIALWRAMEEEEMEECLDTYRLFVEKLGAYPNVIQYYFGSQEWLISNPANYEREQLHGDVARRIVLLCFCDRAYLATPENIDSYLNQLRGQVAQRNENTPAYADLSDYAVVFFGDSIFAYERGTHSVSGVLEGLTGAECYDLSIGGTAASGGSARECSFPYAVESFLSGELVNEEFQEHFATVLQELEAVDISKKKVVFVFNYGVNDYFNSWPVSVEEPMDRRSYAGAMRTGIGLLKEAYPEAELVLVTPMYTNGFSEGTEVLCDDGSGRTLKDYVEAAREIAREEGIHCLDNYNDFGIGTENHRQYLTDGTHPNENGRFFLGKRLAEFLGEKLIK